MLRLLTVAAGVAIVAIFGPLEVVDILRARRGSAGGNFNRGRGWGSEKQDRTMSTRLHKSTIVSPEDSATVRPKVLSAAPLSRDESWIRIRRAHQEGRLSVRKFARFIGRSSSRAHVLLLRAEPPSSGKIRAVPAWVLETKGNR